MTSSVPGIAECLSCMGGIGSVCVCVGELAGMVGIPGRLARLCGYRRDDRIVGNLMDRMQMYLYQWRSNLLKTRRNRSVMAWFRWHLNPGMESRGAAM